MKLVWFIIIIVVATIFFMVHDIGLTGNGKPVEFSSNQLFTDSIKNKVKTGDIILRSGKGFISDVFRQFSLKDKSYSHAGVISIEQNKVYVYHILGGDAKSDKSFRKELIESFCNSKENNAIAVYRYDLSINAKKKMINALQLLHKKKLFFDSHFDLATDSAMYCTELIYKVVNTATGNQEYITVTFVEGNKYIAPDNLYLNPHASLIYSCKY